MLPRSWRSSPQGSSWSRRAWLAHNATALGLFLPRPRRLAGISAVNPATAARMAAQAMRLEPAPWQVLAQQGVEAARAAGAQYADVRLTRTCGQQYWFGGGVDLANAFAEITGVGVRALVNGAWGFAACPWRTTDAVVGVARDAVAQATVNAKVTARSTSQPVELGTVPVVQGTWATPVQIDPFHIPIEEKRDYLAYLQADGDALGINSEPLSGIVEFHRQERVLATSEGTLVTQTCYETGGSWAVEIGNFTMGPFHESPKVKIQGLGVAGRGWEHLLTADIPGQLRRAGAQIRVLEQIPAAKPAVVGRYTLVCDGATMAALLDRTLGVATQLDRALGYEANASGTSWVTDPLAMVGHLQVAAPLVTVTANRSAPGQLATVRWDDEGVVPEPFTLIQNGVLVDLQTTRAQAAWLAPYYARQGWPVRSHGCAAAEDAFGIQLQMQPNLVLAPGAHTARLDDLVADVAHGILMTAGDVTQLDSQGRTGVLTGMMREITNGRLGHPLVGGAVLFDTLDLWKHLVALGGAATEGEIAAPRWSWIGNGGFLQGFRGLDPHPKGQPAQSTSSTTRAVAATITNQPVIDLGRKA